MQSVTQFAGLALACSLALWSGNANAQATVTPLAAEPKQIILEGSSIAEDVCQALQEAAKVNSLPVEFFARIIWQESRFNARAVSPKGAAGIAQFMPQTASWHGLANPFNPIEALRHSASYLRVLRDQFGNLGLAAAAYNAGPGRVSAWLKKHRPLPEETRHYVATVTGWTMDEWASPSPPKDAEAPMPIAIPCTRLANLILPLKEAQRVEADPKQEETQHQTDPKQEVEEHVDARPKLEEAQAMDTHIPRWGIWVAAHPLESKAWAMYREREKRFAALIDNRAPVVLYRELPGMGAAKRYIIAIADESRVPLDSLCAKLTAADFPCDVMRNTFGAN